MENNETKMSFSDRNVLKVINWIQDKVLNAETIDWQKMWTGHYARNYVTERAYSGINCVTCYFANASWLLTDTQIAALDGERWENGKRVAERQYKIHIRKGAKKIPIIHCGKFVPKCNQESATKLYAHWQNGKISKEEYDYKMELLRCFMVNVFYETRAEDVEGLPAKIFEEKPFTPIASAEEIANNPPCPVYFDGLDRCYYSSSADEIHLVPKEAFKTPESMYSTLFHEIGHSTGHPSRCSRNMKNSFGDEAYSKEELVAEIFSAIVCENTGILGDFEKQNTVAYLQNWLSVLKDHPSNLTIAVSQAQKAWNWFAENKLGKTETAATAESEANDNTQPVKEAV